MIDQQGIPSLDLYTGPENIELGIPGDRDHCTQGSITQGTPGFRAGGTHEYAGLGVPLLPGLGVQCPRRICTPDLPRRGTQSLQVLGIPARSSRAPKGIPVVDHQQHLLIFLILPGMDFLTKQVKLQGVRAYLAIRDAPGQGRYTMMIKKSMSVNRLFSDIKDTDLEVE